jgi:hypothetical protein
MSVHSTSPAPHVDDKMVATFIDTVFGYLDGYVPVRLLAEKGTPHQRPHASLFARDELTNALTAAANDAARAARAVYVVPGTVALGSSGKADEIRSTGVVLIDLDDGDIERKRTHLERYLGGPSMVIASGGRTHSGDQKLHLYWRLTEAAEGDDLARVRDLRERIARLAGGDPSFKSLHQPIRVAGTIHGKNGRHALVQILEAKHVEYELSDIEDRVAEMPPVASSEAEAQAHEEGKRAPSATDLMTRTIHEGAIDGVTRFEALSKIIGYWLREARLGNRTQDEAWQAVKQHNATRISPPWPENRLRREFDALQRKDLAAHQSPTQKLDRLPLSMQTSEDALAALFVTCEGSEWLHVAPWGVWFRWTGTAWQRDETGLVRERVRQTCRAVARVCDKQSEIRRICSEKTISAVVRIAASDPVIATRTSELDAHPLLLNTPSGVFDLETGEVRDHDRDMLLTQTTAASPGRGCPRWLQFLD